MKDTLNHLVNAVKDTALYPIIGGTGATAIEVIQQPDLIGRIMQLVVGIVSLIPTLKALFKKRKSNV